MSKLTVWAVAFMVAALAWSAIYFAFPLVKGVALPLLLAGLLAADQSPRRPMWRRLGKDRA